VISYGTYRELRTGNSMGSTDFLFATPSFLTGAGRTLDLGGLLNYSSYNFSMTPEEADSWAIGEDWWSVWHDLRKAVEESEAKAA
jgi:hypothetical protein